MIYALTFCKEKKKTFAIALRNQNVIYLKRISMSIKPIYALRIFNFMSLKKIYNTISNKI